MREARADEGALEDSLIMADAGARASAEIVAELRECSSPKWSAEERRAKLAEILARRVEAAGVAVGDRVGASVCDCGFWRERRGEDDNDWQAGKDPVRRGV